MTVFFILVATGALAHSGVKNPAVKARMDAMGVIGDGTKVLGSMVKGERAFDADEVREAMAQIADHAARTPALFEAPEDDPKSEALPAIWDNFDDFSDKALSLEAVARDISETLADEAEAPAALAQLGKACKACHAVYRE